MLKLAGYQKGEKTPYLAQRGRGTAVGSALFSVVSTAFDSEPPGDLQTVDPAGGPRGPPKPCPAGLGVGR